MDPYQTLCDDHQRLDALYEAWLNGVHVNDAEVEERAWSELDRQLAAHLEAEDTHLLPLFDAFDPAEAAAIRAEHVRIRQLAAELGVLLDIHAVRETKAAELIAFLRTHAAREEAKLYPWANRALPEAPRQSFLQRLREARNAVTAPRGAAP